MWHSTYTPRDTLYLFQVAVQCQWAGVPDRGGCATVRSLNVSLYIKPICFTYRSRVYRTPTSISAPVSDACCAASVHLQWTHSQVFPHIQGTRKPFSVFISAFSAFAFTASTLLVGLQEGHPACENWAVGCWHGYLSGARCRLSYGPADATATHCLFSKIQIGFTFLVPAHLGSLGQRGVKWVCVFCSHN